MATPDHTHCPNGCDKPQPFQHPDGRRLCGRCWFKFGEAVEMVPCTPEFCGDDAPPVTLP